MGAVSDATAKLAADGLCRGAAPEVLQPRRVFMRLASSSIEERWRWPALDGTGQRARAGAVKRRVCPPCRSGRREWPACDVPGRSAANPWAGPLQVARAACGALVR
jgi:hypothetical protein